MVDNSSIVATIGTGGVQGLQDTAKAVLPKIIGAGSFAVNIIVWVIIFIVLGIIAGLVFYFAIQRKRFNNILIIFEKINNVWVDTFLDKGMEVKFSPLGTSVMYFRKLKRNEPMPKIQSGSRKFYFKKYPDGTLINFRLDDNETDDFEKFTDMNKAMLYHHTGINRGLNNRYDKLNPWKEYAPIIISVIFIAMMGVMVWLVMDKMLQIQTVQNAGTESMVKVLDKANSILGKLDNIGSGGSGFVQAGS